MGPGGASGMQAYMMNRSKRAEYWPRAASFNRDDAQPHAYVLLAGPGVELLSGLLARLVRVGDVPRFHVGVVGLFVGDELRIRRPPVPGEAAHLFLRHELREAVRLGE